MSTQARLRTCFGYLVIGALLVTLAACGPKKEPAPPREANKTELADGESDNPGCDDPGLIDPDLRGVAVDREDQVVVDSKVVGGEPNGIPSHKSNVTSATRDQSRDLNSALTSPEPFAPSAGLRGRGGATREKMLRAYGGNAPKKGEPRGGDPKAGADKPPAGLPDLIAGVELQKEAKDESDTESYQLIVDNPYKSVRNDPLSTFSSSVDTASYSNVRSRLNAHELPKPDAVRIADFINYFKYDYALPKNDDPVAFNLEIAKCPWNAKHHLLKIGLQAKKIEKDKMPPRNLVFLIDTSGSMNEPNRLPLVKQSLRLLVDQLTARDRVSIVTYAGSSELALNPTPGNEKDAIMRVVDRLDANGSTNGAGGIVTAYDLAQQNFMKDGVNRVILSTDGDFNVGVSDDAELVRLIEKKRDTGIYLTILGYGIGNLKDSKLEQLAHHGNGHYAYIDTLDEAKKVFVEQGGALVTVAKDVKLQVEFNPGVVAGYRLIGYENRIMRNEDFRNDTKDAGDMGSGHTCTALYEVVPAGEKLKDTDVPPLKYQSSAKLTDAAKSGEWLTVRMRYKDPQTEKAKEVEAALAGAALDKNVSNDFEFAAAVASFGMLLRDSEYRGNATYASVLETAQGLLAGKKDDYREEFVKLVRVALTIEQARPKQ